MGCTYKDLRKPWSSVTVKMQGVHAAIGLWANGALTGSLMLRQEEMYDALRSLTGKEVAKTSSLDKGVHLDILGEPRTPYVISEYGDVLHWDALRRRYPESPVTPLYNLIQWGTGALRSLHFDTGQVAFHLGEDLATALRNGESALEKCKVDDLITALDELKGIRSRYDSWCPAED